MLAEKLHINEGAELKLSHSIFLALTLPFTACASTKQARNVEPSGFPALLGAAKVLSKPEEIKVDITRGNIETVDAIRRKGGS